MGDLPRVALMPPCFLESTQWPVCVRPFSHSMVCFLNPEWVYSLPCAGVAEWGLWGHPDSHRGKTREWAPGLGPGYCQAL